MTRAGIAILKARTTAVIHQMKLSDEEALHALYALIAHRANIEPPEPLMGQLTRAVAAARPAVPS